MNENCSVVAKRESVAQIMMDTTDKLRVAACTLREIGYAIETPEQGESDENREIQDMLTNARVNQKLALEVLNRAAEIKEMILG